MSVDPEPTRPLTRLLLGLAYAALTLTEMTVPQTEAWMTGCAPIQQAAAAREITTREVAQVVQAWTQANWRMTQEEVAKEGGETAAPLLPGALRDNVALLCQHMDEIARLDEENRP